MKKQAGHLEKNAFTLIELLVVIAIISLLVSILLPSLTKAKELARSLLCQTLLRNMASAEFLAFEERGTGEYTPILSARTSPWSQWVSDREFRKCLGLSEDDPDPTYVPQKYICPNSTAPAHPSRADLYYWPASYGWNITDVQFQVDGSGNPNIVYEADKVKSPADRMMISDAINWWTSQNNIPYSVAYRHNENANVVFFDGHTETLDPPVFVTNENFIWNAYQ